MGPLLQQVSDQMRRWGFVQASVFWMNDELANNEHRDQTGECSHLGAEKPRTKNEKKTSKRGDFLESFHPGRAPPPQKTSLHRTKNPPVRLCRKKAKTLCFAVAKRVGPVI